MKWNKDWEVWRRKFHQNYTSDRLCGKQPWNIQKSEEKLINYASSSDLTAVFQSEKAVKPAYKGLVMLC